MTRFKPYLESILQLPAIKKAASIFVDLIYPPLCIHCSFPLEEGYSFFCKPCTVLLTLIDPLERCPGCFSANFSPEDKICSTCREDPPLTDRMAAAFDHEGPAASLVTQMKYGNMPYLAKGAAAFMAVQWAQLQWPLPDLIVPAPISRLRRFDRGYNQSELLAEELSLLLDRPFAAILGRRSGGFSQAGLGRKHRLAISEESFFLRQTAELQDKVVLLIDDVATTGKTLTRCAAIVQQQMPAKIYALTLCRAIQ